METTIINLIQNFGFPTAMCAWFMLRTEKIIKQNTLAMIRFTEMVSYCKMKGGM